MTIAKCKAHLAALVGHVTFEYAGLPCGTSPLSRTRFVLRYGSDDMTATSLAEVFSVKFFGGKSLEEIWGDVTDPEY